MPTKSRLKSLGLGVESTKGKGMPPLSRAQIEANRCGCFNPLLHSRDTLHKQWYEVSVVWKRLLVVFHDAIHDSAHKSVRWLFRRFRSECSCGNCNS